VGVSRPRRGRALRDNHRGRALRDNHRGRALRDNHRGRALRDNHRGERANDHPINQRMSPSWKGEGVGTVCSSTERSVLIADARRGGSINQASVQSQGGGARKFPGHKALQERAGLSQQRAPGGHQPEGVLAQERVR
jgi:hypothetical protein